ncbi:outer membrane beta-barrel protein [Gemmatimonas sp.]|uniref:outer membrane beta-barrel protein n=1 Tax=Gemmatimonas sp. TaxID=1962908 RepID=UPI00286E37A6|nr:outer membrane beta-barrel protein [Gemmatimonas sp.]
MIDHHTVRAATVFATLIALMGTTVPIAAQSAVSDTARRITVGAFVDGVYAFDVNRPSTRDRAFTTQPARHNEFNINLAFVEARLTGGRVRGRVALQAGTSVQSNYAAEPRQGAVSGDVLARSLQEAYAGFQITPRLWIDGGIFYSNSGMEGWVSRDNPVYTRSLVADYSPYYSTGVRATWQATPALTARVDVVNGWQNISESNDDKSLGLRFDWAATPAMTLAWYGYAGNEPRAQRRLFNGVGLTSRIADRLDVLAQFDIGAQQRQDSVTATRTNHAWYGATLVGRLWVSPVVALSARVERFADAEGVLATTATGVPFRTNGASVGLDIRPEPTMLWRTELRGLAADGAVFPSSRDASGYARRNGVFVTSLALTF